MIDTGVDYNHPDLSANIWTNPGEIAGDGIDNDSNGYIDDVRGWDFAYNDNNPMDVHGHGTHVAGTIAGKGNNGVGVTGVAWNAKIMPLKFLNDSGWGYTSDAISAINYATAKGVKLTNNSWGGDGYTQALYDAINTAGQQGALFIAAAGNSSQNTDTTPAYPASYDLANIISVASTTRTDGLSWFSNYGATTVDLGAPGSDIYSAWPNSTYNTISGTSMASPHVTGAAALLWSQNPTWTAQQVKNRLMSTGDSISALNGKTVSGKRLNIYNALMSSNLPTVTVNVSPVTVQEDGSGNLTYSFSRSGNLTSAMTVNFGVAGTANAAAVGSDPADYTVLTNSAVTFSPSTKTGTITFAAGSSTAQLVVDPTADTLAESQNETVVFNINSGTGYIGGTPNTATGTIVSEEVLPIFTNPNSITIPSSGSASPYPSTINVSGVSGNIANIQVSLSGLSHTWPDDVDMFLRGPGGQKVMLMSDAGDFADLNNVNLTFSDSASGTLPDGSQITSGTYRPTDYQVGDTFPTPAPAGPYGTALSAFNGTNPNGAWQLFVQDDTGWDSGSIAGGWSLTIQRTSTINGTAGADNLIGTANPDIINGLAGNDTLNGNTGADTLVGGLGNDIYVVDNTGDIATELASQGTDLIQSSVTYTLPANVEDLTLTGTTAINGTGNALANIITGNTANNILDGSSGADQLKGGTGNDTYVVDNTGDVVTELASQGTDLIQSSVTYTLPANVEDLTLTGTTAINGTGNTVANIITGNTANNILDGSSGADQLKGGTGNDTYVVDNTGDVVTELASQGTDLIQSSVTYTLPANVEDLTLTGTTAINGTGNTLANTVTGNTANNILNGGTGNDNLIGGSGTDQLLGSDGNDSLSGDAGNDTLTGGLGADKFIYNTNAAFTTTAVGVDTITDFNISQTDQIVLDKTTFTSISSAAGTGFSVASEFAKVTSDALAATSAADIVYNTATGGLFYNQNGTAAGLGTGAQFLTLTNKPALTATQFLIQA
ncbi:Thermitase [Planktothrix agardhii]|uniref:Peptidase S8 and S53 n=1 Tax=Planktothrix agardhii (strain NIVA-CYA 126/8) TaxID=388467 RepID=A0A073CRV2_PLAA1|nr:S8 family serine peptidase [Planktothrix agardhii]KEI66745.1 peptidase S8 and S53 [Planktothrix agardhii NIVA-CYA 126/8]CAD5963917.1 Thermitase [Planktothrix agardhii]